MNIKETQQKHWQKTDTFFRANESLSGKTVAALS